MKQAKRVSKKIERIKSLLEDLKEQIEDLSAEDEDCDDYAELSDYIDYAIENLDDAAEVCER